MEPAEIYRILAERETPPRPWSGSGEVPWSDPDFSRDYARAAARDPATTRRELDWIVSTCGLPLAPGSGQAWSILDVGCGDGRLLLPLCRMGHEGWGFDLGPAPVERLREQAARQRLTCTARTGDLRDWTQGAWSLGPVGAFDLVLCSFGTLGAIPAGDALLARCAEVLAVGGWLLLDTGLSRGFAAELDGRQEWWTAEDFVLGAGPQLVLDDHSFDADRGVYVRRSFALHLGGALEVAEVRQTSRLYEADELNALLGAAGFEAVEVAGDFDGSDYDPESSENLVIAARRRA
jgi:SAM-dependent methyltransferase